MEKLQTAASAIKYRPYQTEHLAKEEKCAHFFQIEAMYPFKILLFLIVFYYKKRQKITLTNKELGVIIRAT